VGSGRKAVSRKKEARTGGPLWNRSVLPHAASGQIKASANRSRLTGETVLKSRQRSLNLSPAFSMGTASHHDRHGPSSLASTSLLMSISLGAALGWRRDLVRPVCPALLGLKPSPISPSPLSVSAPDRASRAAADGAQSGDTVDSRATAT
jgi:hypothetical protein